MLLIYKVYIYFFSIMVLAITTSFIKLIITLNVIKPNHYLFSSLFNSIVMTFRIFINIMSEHHQKPLYHHHNLYHHYHVIY